MEGSRGLPDHRHITTRYLGGWQSFGIQAQQWLQSQGFRLDIRRNGRVGEGSSQEGGGHGSGGTWGARLRPRARGILYALTALWGDPQNPQGMETKSASEGGGSRFWGHVMPTLPLPHPSCRDTSITICMTAATASAIKLTQCFLCLWKLHVPRAQIGTQGVSGNGLSNLSQGLLFPLPHSQPTLKCHPGTTWTPQPGCPWSSTHPESPQMGHPTPPDGPPCCCWTWTARHPGPCRHPRTLESPRTGPLRTTPQSPHTENWASWGCPGVTPNPKVIQNWVPPGHPKTPG